MELPLYLQVFSEEYRNNTYFPVIIASIYVFVIMFLAPAYMKNRPPFKLKKVIIAYNFIQVVANLYFASSLVLAFIPHIKYQCGIMKSERFTPMWKDVRGIIESMFFLRIFDLLDSLFFALRKKHQNISFLHVYHHSAVPVLFYYSVATFSVGFSMGVGVAINSYVHSLMYFYYGLAAFGPKVKKYLWWKKYLTLIQILLENLFYADKMCWLLYESYRGWPFSSALTGQFAFILSFWAYNVRRGCEELGKFGWIIFVYIITILILFLNYYKHAFKPKLSVKFSKKE